MDFNNLLESIEQNREKVEANVGRINEAIVSKDKNKATLQENYCTLEALYKKSKEFVAGSNSEDISSYFGDGHTFFESKDTYGNKTFNVKLNSFKSSYDVIDAYPLIREMVELCDATPGLIYENDSVKHSLIFTACGIEEGVDKGAEKVPVQGGDGTGKTEELDKIPSKKAGEQPADKEEEKVPEKKTGDGTGSTKDMKESADIDEGSCVKEEDKKEDEEDKKEEVEESLNESKELIKDLIAKTYKEMMEDLWPKVRGQIPEWTEANEELKGYTVDQWLTATDEYLKDMMDEEVEDEKEEEEEEVEDKKEDGDDEDKEEAEVEEKTDEEIEEKKDKDDDEDEKKKEEVEEAKDSEEQEKASAKSE